MDQYQGSWDRPVTAIIGGSKISTKINLLNNLAQKFNFLVIGGGMANTFLKAAGFNIGKSLYEEDYLNSAIKISKIAERWWWMFDGRN